MDNILLIARVAYITRRKNNYYMTENSAKKLYNVTETSKLLGISKAKVYDLIANGFLSALDLGGLKISNASIDKFIDSYTGFSFKDISNVCRLQLS